MPEFHFYHSIEIRYGDLDPQGHVNNAKYLTFMEQTRSKYLKHLGLWDGESFLDIGIILAEARVTFRAPIYYGQDIRVCTRVSKLGNKSITMEYLIEENGSRTELASGTAVVVAYDYRTGTTVPIPDQWRQVISAFEGAALP